MMMKHSQKMILVPERTLDNFQRQQQQIAAPTVVKLADLDDEMKSIWDRKDTSQEQKAKLYSEILEKYLRFKDKRNLETKEPIAISLTKGELNDSLKGQLNNSADPAVTTSKQSVADIVEILPKTLRPKAKMILKRIGDNPEVINWNERGELKYKGKVVPNTNISDLVGDSLRQRKSYKPEGYDVFSKALRQINIPEDLIRNPDRLQLLRTQDNKTPAGKRMPSTPTDDEMTPGTSSANKRSKKKEKNENPKWLTNF